MTLQELQSLIDTMYSRKDEERGIEGTFMWLMEEVGELATALRSGTKEELAMEFADVLAWLASLSEQLGLSLDDAVARYAQGCPKCGSLPCHC